MACCGDAPSLDSAVLCTLFNSFVQVPSDSTPCLEGAVEYIVRHDGVCKRIQVPCIRRFRLV